MSLLYRKHVFPKQIRRYNHQRYQRCDTNVTFVLRDKKFQYIIRHVQKRCYHELSYLQHGKPSLNIEYSSGTDLRQHKNQYDHFEGSQLIHVEMIAAPWNPADALSVQGYYPNPYNDGTNQVTIDQNIANISCQSCLVQNGTVPGAEGWGRIIDIHNVGSSSTSEFDRNNNFQIGDYVVPGQPGLGTLRSSFWVPSSGVIQIHRGKELYDQCGPYEPASLFQTGGTALRMLLDFVPLQSGDIVVQNAGNSAVGFMTSQIAVNLLNCYCISLIRSDNRTPEQFIELQRYLQSQGMSTLVLPDDDSKSNNEIRSHIFETLQTTFGVELKSNPIRLALNAIGGSSINRLAQLLDLGGIVVTYGGMSKQPNMIDTSQFIFHDTHFHGYWHSRWMVQQQQRSRSAIHTNDQRSVVINQLVDAVLDGKLICPSTVAFPLSKFKNAFSNESASKSTIRSKIVFDCQERVL